jgi:pimeloyl-ACP methyl ester carboxylesterase
MNDVIGAAYRPALAHLSNGAHLLNGYTGAVDFMEAGAGPLVVLVHSSMAGARQWAPLMQELQHHALVRAVNLFGYGNTPAWSGVNPPSLADFAELVALAVPDTASDISLVGHSLGAAVAMHAAADQLRGRVKNLVLIEPSLFYLLDLCGRWEAFDEISALAEYTKRRISNGDLEAAAEGFIDYWCGPCTWAASNPSRQAAFARSVSLLAHEWKVVLEGKMTAAEWAAALPQHTLLMSSTHTTRPSRELIELLSNARPEWEVASLWETGHMAPLTHPQVVNPIIQGFLERGALRSDATRPPPRPMPHRGTRIRA